MHSIVSAKCTAVLPCIPVQHTRQCPSPCLLHTVQTTSNPWVPTRAHVPVCSYGKAAGSRWQGATHIQCNAAAQECNTDQEEDEQQEEQDGVSIILYTKQDCPLCQGLQEKVEGLIARAQFMPCALTGATLEVRDISADERWREPYQLSVPVLALVGPQGEVVVPRPPPRITADRLQKQLEEAIASL